MIGYLVLPIVNEIGRMYKIQTDFNDQYKELKQIQHNFYYLRERYKKKVEAIRFVGLIFPESQKIFQFKKFMHWNFLNEEYIKKHGKNELDYFILASSMQFGK